MSKKRLDSNAEQTYAPWDKGTVLLSHFPTEIIARKPGLIVGRVGRKNRPLVP